MHDLIPDEMTQFGRYTTFEVKDLNRGLPYLISKDLSLTPKISTVLGLGDMQPVSFKAGKAASHAKGLSPVSSHILCSRRRLVLQLADDAVPSPFDQRRC